MSKSFTLPKLSIELEEYQDFLRCPRYFRFKYIQRIRKPIPMRRLEDDIHKSCLKEAISEGLTCEEHVAIATHRFEEGLDFSIAGDNRATVEDAAFRIRAIPKLWHRVESKDFIPGDYKLGPEVDVPCGRYTIHVPIDLSCDKVSYYVGSVMKTNVTYESDDPIGGLMAAAQKIVHSKGAKLNTIAINLSVAAKRPIFIRNTKRVFAIPRALDIAEDAMDMMNANIFPRFNTMSSWCSKSYCEYWGVCWSRRTK